MYSDVEQNDIFKEKETGLIQGNSEDVYTLLGQKGNLQGIWESSHFLAVKRYFIYLTKNWHMWQESWLIL